MLVAQVSDLHMMAPGIRGLAGYDPASALTAVLARVATLKPRPELVLLTGDLTEHGDPAEYTALRAVLAEFDLPMVAIPGNHDRREAFAEGLAGTGVEIGTPPFLHLVVEAGRLRLIGLDTLANAGEDVGKMCGVRLHWLAARLAEAPDQPTMIFMHHPPFAIGIDFMDEIACADGAAAMEAIVARHPQVRRVACGHVHRPVTLAWGGTVAGTCPSVAPAVALDLAPNAPPRIVPYPPGFQLHRWTGAGEIVTHTEYLASA
jgi:3',5'-cyclic AMP phosphodiesterase CpdA